MTQEHPYRGTVQVIPDPPPERLSSAQVWLFIILTINWFVVGVLLS